MIGATLLRPDVGQIIDWLLFWAPKKGFHKNVLRIFYFSSITQIIYS